MQQALASTDKRDPVVLPGLHFYITLCPSSLSLHLLTPT